VWQERSSKRLEHVTSRLRTCCNTISYWLWGNTISYWPALMYHACLLARIRLTRMAAERGPILSGACGQVNGFQTLIVQVPSVCEPPQ
jgi:hypothetical protein